MENNENSKGKFWKGVLAGSLVTAFVGLTIVGVATGIQLIAETMMNNQTNTYVETQVDNEAEDNSETPLAVDINYDRIEAKLKQIQEIIETHYLFEEEEQMMEDGIYTGFMYGLGDPYSVYYNEENFAKLMETTEGSYCGIGASVSQNRSTGLSTIVRVFRGSPAEEAGMLPGDVIYKVDDVNASEIDLDLLISQHIRGEEFSYVKITVFRNAVNDYVDLKIQRRQIEVETVEYHMLEDKVGYILITQFDLMTPRQFQMAVEELEAEGMESLVVDLRNNPGGVLDAVVEMIAYVLPEDKLGGMLVYTEDRNSNGDQYYSKNGKIHCDRYDRMRNSEYPKTDGHQLDLPMVVLTNGASASASEIFAGAMKDYEWATLVGTTTFGKGIVQNLIPLRDGTAIKLTTSHYFTPDGFDLHGKGIEPDIEIELDEALLTKVTVEFEEDNQLQKALEVLKSKK